MNLYRKKLNFEESKKSALKGFATQHTIKAPKKQTFDTKTFLGAVKQKALEKCKPQTKVRIVLRVRLEKCIPAAIEDNQMVEVHNFQSKTEIVLESTNLDTLRTEMCEQVFENVEVFTNERVWNDLSSIVGLDNHTVEYKPLGGSSWIPLPSFLRTKRLWLT